MNAFPTIGATDERNIRSRTDGPNRAMAENTSGTCTVIGADPSNAYTPATTDAIWV